jgi:serine/threonine protein kinase
MQFVGIARIDSKLCFVMKLYEHGSLDKLHHNKFIDFTEMRYFLKLMKHVAAGACHLHGLGIVHRDIRCANVLVTGDLRNGKFTAALGDWGLARQVGDAAEKLPKKARKGVDASGNDESKGKLANSGIIDLKASDPSAAATTDRGSNSGWGGNTSIELRPRQTSMDVGTSAGQEAKAFRTFRGGFYEKNVASNQKGPYAVLLFKKIYHYKSAMLCNIN